MSETVAAFDLGTGGIKAAIFGRDGRLLAEHVTPYRTFYPSPSRHEQRPVDWWSAFGSSFRALLQDPAIDPAAVRAIAISGHSLGCVPLSEDGGLLEEFVPIWSDGRADKQAADFFARFDDARWYQTTGNGFPAPLYTLFKVMWLREERPDVFARTRAIAGTKDYLNLRLTGRLLTDPSYASGSGFFDLEAGEYSDEILAAAGLDGALFPAVVASTTTIGEVLPEVAAEFGLASGVRVVAGGVDNSCMALGAATFADGDVFSAMGSSSWLTVSSAHPLLDDGVRSYAFAHVVPQQFISATSIFSSGTSIGWIKEKVLSGLGDGARQPGENSYADMMRLAASAPPGARGLLFVPTLAGGTAFEGGPAVRGAFIGLDLRHGHAELVRAGLEGVAMGLRLALDALREMAELRDEMVVVGGGAQSALWRQIMADVFDCAIVKTNIDQEAAALGAAALALVGIGAWRDFEPLRGLHAVEGRSIPVPSDRPIYETALAAYRQAAIQQRELSPVLAKLRAMTS